MPRHFFWESSIIGPAMFAMTSRDVRPGQISIPLVQVYIFHNEKDVPSVTAMVGTNPNPVWDSGAYPP